MKSRAKWKRDGSISRFIFKAIAMEQKQLSVNVIGSNVNGSNVKSNSTWNGNSRSSSVCHVGELVALHFLRNHIVQLNENHKVHDGCTYHLKWCKRMSCNGETWTIDSVKSKATWRFNKLTRKQSFQLKSKKPHVNFTWFVVSCWMKSWIWYKKRKQSKFIWNCRKPYIVIISIVSSLIELDSEEKFSDLFLLLDSRFTSP